MSVVNQELFCHNCNGYVQFSLDDELDGERIITCPNCKHEHYRYVDKGRITDRRWGSANRQQTASFYIPQRATTYTSSTSTSGGRGGTGSYTYATWGTSTATSW